MKEEKYLIIHKKYKLPMCKGLSFHKDDNGKRIYRVCVTNRLYEARKFKSRDDAINCLDNNYVKHGDVGSQWKIMKENKYLEAVRLRIEAYL